MVKKEVLQNKMVTLEKERSQRLEDQAELVVRATELAKEEGYSRVSLKNDLGDSWEVEYIV